jgi:hypothetical protein
MLILNQIVLISQNRAETLRTNTRMKKEIMMSMMSCLMMMINNHRAQVETLDHDQSKRQTVNNNSPLLQ